MSKGVGGILRGGGGGDGGSELRKRQQNVFLPRRLCEREGSDSANTLQAALFSGADVPMPAPEVSSLSLFSRDFFFFFFHFKWLKKGSLLSLSPRIPICRRAPGDVRAHRCNLAQVCHTGLRTNMQKKNHLQKNCPVPTGWSRANKDTFPWLIHQQMWFSVSPGFRTCPTALFLFCPFYQHKRLPTRYQGFSDLIFEGLKLISRQGQRSRTTADERNHFIQFAYNLPPKENSHHLPAVVTFTWWIYRLLINIRKYQKTQQWSINMIELRVRGVLTLLRYNL